MNEEVSKAVFDVDGDMIFNTVWRCVMGSTPRRHDVWDELFVEALGPLGYITGPLFSLSNLNM
jgi:hypothetical protein